MSSVELLFGTLAGGVLSFFSPCIFPLLPVYLGYLSGEDELLSMQDADRTANKQAQRKLQINVLVFVAGISTVFIILGVIAGTMGAWLIESAPVLVKVAGAAVIILGLFQLNLINLPILQQGRRFAFDRAQGGYARSYVLGLTFSFGWTPCVGPVLSSILLLSTTQGGALNAALLLLVYAIGFGLPFLMISFFLGVFFQQYKKVYPYLEGIRMVGGILLIVMGILLFTDQLNILQGL